MNSPTTKEALQEMPISIQDMNNAFDDYAKRNWDRIELSKKTFPNYDPEMMKHDSRIAWELKLKFENDTAKRLADLLEKSIYYCWEQMDWFWPDVATVLSSEYDDYVNWVDLILEFDKSDKSFIWIAADITYSKSVSKKFDKIKSNIDSQKLATIKYYSHEDFSWMIRNIPKIVIDLPEHEIRELAKKVYFLVAQSELKTSKELRKSLNEDLENSPLKLLIIIQSVIQLIAFRRYAQNRLILIKKWKLDWDVRRMESMIHRFDTSISAMESILKEGDWLDSTLSRTKSSVDSALSWNEWENYFWEWFLGDRFAWVNETLKWHTWILKKYNDIFAKLSQELIKFR